MAFTPIFYGRVDRDGKLQIDRHFQRPLMEHLRSLLGKSVEVTVRLKRAQRTTHQNAYLHAVPIPILAEHFGYTIPEMKLVLMGECWGWKRDPVSGHEIPIKPSTAEMSVEDCKYFIDWVIPWAAENHQVMIPLPNEVAA